MKQYLANLKEKATRHKTLLHNFGYLSSLQVFGLLIPIATYPYLIRTLGSETYGLVLFAQAVIAFLTIIISFGFNVSATKEISINRHNKGKISEIVSAVIILKAILTVISFLILVLLIFTIPSFKLHKVLYLLTFTICINDFIFPIWYFQGIEKMKYITFGSIMAKLSFLILMFFMIKKQSDYLFVPILNGVGSIIGSSYALYIIFVKDQVIFTIQPLKKLIYYAKDSFLFFTTSISITIYSTSTRLIIGSYLGLVDLAYYDLADKIISLTKLPFTIIGQTVLPKIASARDSMFIKSLSGKIFLLSIATFIFVLVFSQLAVKLLGGSKMIEAYVYVNILAVGLLPAMYKYIGLQALATWGYQKDFFTLSAIMLFVFIVLMIVLKATNFLSLYTITISNVIVELFGAIYFQHLSKKYKIL